MPATWDDGAANVLDLAGRQPRRSTHIEDTMRGVGYLGLMVNVDEFYQAAIWASNMIDRYDQFSRPMVDRIVIPIEDLRGFDKKIVVQSYYLLIVYYHRKGNTHLVEMLLNQLMNLAKFQTMKRADIPVMEMWDDYLADMRQNMRLGDFSAPPGHALEGKKDVLDRYRALVEKERESFRKELRKESGLDI